MIDHNGQDLESEVRVANTRSLFSKRRLLIVYPGPAAIRLNSAFSSGIVMPMAPAVVSAKLSIGEPAGEPHWPRLQGFQGVVLRPSEGVGARAIVSSRSNAYTIAFARRVQRRRRR
jgi:hypothetical protein